MADTRKGGRFPAKGKAPPPGKFKAAKKLPAKDSNRKPSNARDNPKRPPEGPADKGGSANDRLAREVTERVRQRVGKFAS